MNYELAKELKDAGFTQYLEPCIFPKEITKGELRPPELTTDMLYDTRAYVPNLSELIEACGPQKADYFNLEALMGGWTANLVYHGHFEGWTGIKRDEMGFVEIDIDEDGDTPEEAVARLWLTLNS